MSFECVKKDYEMYFVCDKHGEIPIRAEILLRQSKVNYVREKKKPGVKKVNLVTIRCAMCKTYEEYEVPDLKT